MIELPKDAEGREIPLDTECLYTYKGEKQDVLSFTYYRREDIWEIETDMRTVNSIYLYLTPPDSWEKLEEDLSEISKGTVCHYFHKGDSNTCEGCPAAGTGSCWPTMARGITSRISKLRGED